MAHRYLTDTRGETFCLFEDAPDLLYPVDEKDFRELWNSGFSEANARELATEAPFRVAAGFGYFENHGTFEAAILAANEQAEHWRDGEALGPEVLRRQGDEYEVVARPCIGDFATCEIGSREAVAV